MVFRSATLSDYNIDVSIHQFIKTVSIKIYHDGNGNTYKNYLNSNKFWNFYYFLHFRCLYIGFNNLS